MEFSKKFNYGADVCKIIFDNLDIRVKTVGIIVDDLYGTEATYELYYSLCTHRDDLKIALIPGDLAKPNLILLPEDVLGIYLYSGVSSEVVKTHDIWVTVKNGEITFNTNLHETTVSGNKFVLANQMKSVVSQVDTSKISDHPVDMLFSAKSMALRMPSDWWIEFPENTDQKLMTVNVLKYIQDNEAIFARVIRQVKDRIVDGTFGMGIILDFPEYPNVKATMEDGARGKFVVIKVGMVGFYFSTERTMFLDWHALMIDQLDELAGE